MRPRIVMKFGGTSLAGPEVIESVRNIILSRKQDRPLVVVSAPGDIDGMPKVTDILLDLGNSALTGGDTDAPFLAVKNRYGDIIAGLSLKKDLIDSHFENLKKDILKARSGRFKNKDAALDAIMGWGEILFAVLMAEYLSDGEESYRAALPDEFPLITDDNFQNAKFLDSTLDEIAKSIISSNENLVFPGYAGRTESGEKTTIGRGGSDYTAAMLGAALKKDVEIWTDVPGIYRVNPAYLDEKTLQDRHPEVIPELSHDEAYQMAAFGSRVLYEKTLAAARSAARKGRHIRFIIKSTLEPDMPGTMISSQRVYSGKPKGITCLEGVQLLTLYPGDDFAINELLMEIGRVKGCELVLFSFTRGRASFVFNRYTPELSEIEARHGGHLSKDQALVKIIGDGLGENKSVLADVHHILDFVENPEEFGMNLVHKSPLLITDNSFEIIVKKRGFHRVVRSLYRELFQSGEIRVGMMGLGTVARGVLKYADELYSMEKTGYSLRFPVIMVRRPERFKDEELPGRLSDNPGDVLDDPSLDVVLELIGGIEPAREYVLEAFRKGKHVVTANKALLAEHGPEIFAAARKYRRNLGFEASVCGELPVIDDFLKMPSRTDIRGFVGILNGTSNYILTRLQEGLEFNEALSEAQKLGFAEADPALDLSGMDAAQKLSILSSIIFFRTVPYRDIPTFGIDNITKLDCETARDMGFGIKPVAMAGRKDNGLLFWVGPVLIPVSNPLYPVSRENNAVSIYVEGRDEPGTRIGKGAGAIPTARSVCRDLIDVVKKGRSRFLDLPGFDLENENIPPILPAGEISAPWYLRFTVKDEPGVFGDIATCLGRHGLSIGRASQPERPAGGLPYVILTLQEEKWKILDEALKEISGFPFVLKYQVCLIFNRTWI